MATTGERIRQARLRAVFGQAELAREVDMSVSGLWAIEHGLRQPRPATVRKIAAALGVPPFDLVENRESSD